MVASLQVLIFLSCQYLQVIKAFLFIVGLAEEEELLVMFPFRHVELVRRSVGLNRLVLTVENRPKVFKLALYVVNCSTTTKRSQVQMKETDKHA